MAHLGMYIQPSFMETSGPTSGSEMIQKKRKKQLDMMDIQTYILCMNHLQTKTKPFARWIQISIAYAKRIRQRNGIYIGEEKEQAHHVAEASEEPIGYFTPQTWVIEQHKLGEAWSRVTLVTSQRAWSVSQKKCYWSEGFFPHQILSSIIF